MDLEAERVTSIIINKAIHDLPTINSNKLLLTKRNEKEEIEQISYNTIYINEIKDNLVKNIQDELSKIENGNFEEYDLIQQNNSRNKIKKWKNGFICDINLNSIRGSMLFGNVGPTIPIKLSYLGYTYVDIEQSTKEYGINNIIVQTNASITVTSIITMPISSKKHNISINQPLSIEIIKGEVPSYYNGVISNK